MKFSYIQIITGFLAGVKKKFSKAANEDLVIGQLLRKNNIISQNQLETALAFQKKKLYQEGKVVRLGLIIVELGYADEPDIVEIINQNYKLSINSLSDNIKELLKIRRGTFIESLPRPHLPIWLKLSLITMLIIITTMFSLSIIILNKQEERLYDHTLKLGMVSLNYFVNNARIPLLDDDILRLNTLIKEAATVDGLLYAGIVDQHEKIMAHTNINKIGGQFQQFKNVTKISQQGEVTCFNYTLASGKHILNLCRPIIFDGKNLGKVHVGVSLDFITEQIHKERTFIIIVIFFVLLLGLVVSIIFGLRFSSPITRLLEATAQIGKGNYQHKVLLKRKDELGNLAAAFNQMGEELWKNALTQKSFGKYVGPEVLEMIMANPETTWLKGKKNEATILFADIRGFTSFSNENSPEAVVQVLNQYFEIASRIILRYGGYIDKFIGDAVLGVFGVPVYRQDHVERAVRAGLDLEKGLKRENHPLLASVGIGIHTGVVVSGNIGSQIKMEYTVIGDCVNLASRLNGLAGKGETLISKTVYRQIKDIITVEVLSPRIIKGQSDKIPVYKVLSIQERANVQADS